MMTFRPVIQALKVPALALGMGFAALSASAQLSPSITSWYLNTSGYTGYGGIEADCQQVEYSTNHVYVSCSGIPAYTIGPWNNPNIPADKNWVFKFPRNPVENTGTKTVVGQGQIAVLVNGVPIFHPGDGMSYNNGNVWFRIANHFEEVSFDATNGHPTPTSDYHYHINALPLAPNTSTQHSDLIGFAFDGFPIYGPFGYTSPMNSGSGISRMESSYQLRNISDRTTLPDGTVLQPNQYGPSIGGQYTLGAFIEDYEYVAGSGDLDEYNGRLCVTPEYPGGTYAYFVTTDANHDATYPFFIGQEYYGVVTAGNTGPTGGHVTITEPTTVWTGSVGTAAAAAGARLNVYPNPAEEFVYVALEEITGGVDATLLNAMGQHVWEGHLSGTGAKIDVEALPAGVYVLKAGDTAQKLIVR